VATQTEQANLAAALRYLELIERFALPSEFEGILHPDVQLHEYPNLLMKTSSQRDLAAMANGAQQGRKILSENRYEVTNTIAAGEWVTLQIVWTGTLAIALGEIPEGGQLKAYIATILRFRDGLIIEQYQYDCYEPLPVA
jgi:hypothetical protein